MGKRVLFLYSELAGYFLSCIQELNKNPELKIFIIHWKVNAIAPFSFSVPDNVTMVNKEELDDHKVRSMALSMEADLVFVAGWMDKVYLDITKKYKKSGVKIIMGLDNPWKGNLRQRIGSFILPYYLKKRVDYIWCAGVRQYEYARRLGYGIDKIRLGLYSCDVESFQKKCNRRNNDYPLTLVYIGRLVEEKGIRELYQAFTELQKENPSEWKLVLIGNGPLGNEITSSDQVEIHGFMQPEEILDRAHSFGAFCLPSREEHWGVVVHEFAALGLPLVVSDQVNAGTAFVHPGYNGFRFKAGDKASLKIELKKLFALSIEKLVIMGERSGKLSNQITPAIWASVIEEILE